MEPAPTIKEKELLKTMTQPLPTVLASLVSAINAQYEYWDSVKYKKLPEDYSAIDLWRIVKAERSKTNITVWQKYHIHFGLTAKMQQQCHEFDMNFGGFGGSADILTDAHKERYLISSLMEEAIFSSQMEGASTTRKIAKEMLRKHSSPKDKSQQMIFNNYQTIQFITANKEQPLTAELLCQIHRLMTDKTLENSEYAGRFRQNNEVVVENSITHEVVHMPPPYKELPAFVQEFCTFFNSDSNNPFIHPIIKGIIIHFMVAYMHPFVDGNGRTARALFYWYMLKQGYWLTEYLSISRIIYKSKRAYENSYLYAEIDKNDIGYFIAYNLRVLELAFKELRQYIKRKTQERETATSLLQLAPINERQAEIIQLLCDNPKAMLTVKELQTRFLVTATTAKSDLMGLIHIGLIQEIALNKVKKGYLRSEQFEETLHQLQHTK